MLCEKRSPRLHLSHTMVLILVLLEYALRGGAQTLRRRGCSKVLILVLLEYALREYLWKIVGYYPYVLILVLLEYALRV